MFDANTYGEEVARILALDGSGARLMPLARTECSSARALEQLRQTTAIELFPGSRSPEAAMAGLYFYFSCWEDAHAAAQAIDAAEGSYWHAIVHRQEPDAGNSSYWFSRVGAHPIFPELHGRAVAAGLDLPGPRWDPLAFIQFCERARGGPGSELERQALELQLAEWQLLFGFCAAPAAGGKR